MRSRIRASKPSTISLSPGSGGGAAGVGSADAGFVVAAIDHPLDGGHTKDRSHMGALEVWNGRTADIRRLTDFMLAGWADHARIDPARIGFYGFSRGGFTGLVLIGGNPDFEKFASLCGGYPKLRMCAQLKAGERPPLPHDPRIRAAVLADPVIGRIFAPADLKDIVVPIQLWASEQGGDGVLPHEVATMAKGLPTAPKMHVVIGAAHFAFLPPCGAELARLAADEGICADAAGFDRAGFHTEMNRAVVAFFRAQLAARN